MLSGHIKRKDITKEYINIDKISRNLQKKYAYVFYCINHGLADKLSCKMDALQIKIIFKKTGNQLQEQQKKICKNRNKPKIDVNVEKCYRISFNSS